MAEIDARRGAAAAPADSRGQPGMTRGDDSPSAMILNQQRLSTEDGPGLRTTVFFKGCPLSCQWCHNPESISSNFQIHWLKTRCIGCRTCISVCPSACLELTPQGMTIDRDRCDLCLACTAACPTGAMEQLGREVFLPDLLTDLLNDRAYYETSGGGVTASGGEPTLQAGFVRAMFAELKASGIHTALDTCGLTRFETLESLLPFTDLVLYDLKVLDPNRHSALTGSSSRLIVENLIKLAAAVDQGQPKQKIWIRTPLIPGTTAETENIRAIAQLIRQQLNGQIERWELCAFNNLCRDKYARLGMTWLYEGVPLLDQERINELLQTARGCGLESEKVIVTGALLPETFEVSAPSEK